MRKLIYFAVAILAVIGLSGCTGGQNTPADQMSFSYVENDSFQVAIKEIKTDKQVYHVDEELTISVVLDNVKSSGEILLEVVGLTDIYGDDFVSKKKYVQVEEPNGTEYSQTFTMPDAEACAGFPEGEYVIKAIAHYGDRSLSEKETSITLEKDDLTTS